MSRFDIEIRLRLLNDRNTFEARSIVQALDSIEAALYESDRRDVETASRSLDLPAYVRDASLERIRQHRNRRLLLTDARRGSLELIAVVAGVSYFVLKNTIGETFSEAYRESETRERLKEFFRRQIDEKGLVIAESMRRALRRRRHTSEVRMLPRDEGRAQIIEVDLGVAPSDERQAGPLGEELD